MKSFLRRGFRQHTSLLNSNRAWIFLHGGKIYLPPSSRGFPQLLNWVECAD